MGLFETVKKLITLNQELKKQRLDNKKLMLEIEKIQIEIRNLKGQLEKQRQFVRSTSFDDLIRTMESIKKLGVRTSERLESFHQQQVNNTKDTQQMYNNIMDNLKIQSREIYVNLRGLLDAFDLQNKTTNYLKVWELTKQELSKKATDSKIIKLRDKPTKLSRQEANEMIQKYNFFNGHNYLHEKGIINQYQPDNDVVIDNATGLFWQQSGSLSYMLFRETSNYIEKLNKSQFAGYHDWRLPTLEEAMSLVDLDVNENDLYIDPIFDRTQGCIWTCDKYGSYLQWFVFFYFGHCLFVPPEHANYVRAVRSKVSYE